MDRGLQSNDENRAKFQLIYYDGNGNHCNAGEEIFKQMNETMFWELFRMARKIDTILYGKMGLKNV